MHDCIYVTCPEEANPRRQRSQRVAWWFPGAAEGIGKKLPHMHSVSFWREENALEPAQWLQNAVNVLYVLLNCSRE